MRKSRVVLVAFLRCRVAAGHCAFFALSPSAVALPLAVFTGACGRVAGSDAGPTRARRSHHRAAHPRRRTATSQATQEVPESPQQAVPGGAMRRHALLFLPALAFQQLPAGRVTGSDASRRFARREPHAPRVSARMETAVAFGNVPTATAGLRSRMRPLARTVRLMRARSTPRQARWAWSCDARPSTPRAPRRIPGVFRRAGNAVTSRTRSYTA
jgi:hypothetical protein